MKNLRGWTRGVLWTAGMLFGVGAGGSACNPGDERICPDQQAHLCTISYDCDDGCGGLYPVDEEGCLRPLCTADADCGSGETCYMPGAWGGCFHADVQCRDVDGSCECEGMSGCESGGFCVPEVSLPESREIQPGPVSVEDTCMPGGGPGVRVRVGDSAMDGSVMIEIWEPAPLAPGKYRTASGGSFCTQIDGESNCAGGLLEIESWENDVVSGTFHGNVRGFVEGTFTDAPYVATAPMCNVPLP